MSFNPPVMFCEFDEFIVKHFNSIRDHIIFKSLSILKDRTLADDAVGITMCKLVLFARPRWNGFRLPNGEANIRGITSYITKCAGHAAFEIRNGNRGEERLPNPGDIADDSSYENLIAEDRMKAVRDALFELGNDERQLIYLFFDENMGDLEIARLLDITPGASKLRRFRAMRRLRDILRRRFPDLRFPDDLA